jgi:hypothetical protein
MAVKLGWIGIALTVVMMAIAAPAANEIEVSFRRPGPSVTFRDLDYSIYTELFSIDWSVDWASIPRVGTDSNGNQAAFEFYTLIGVNHEYGWEFASWENVQDGITGETIDVQTFLREKLSDPGLRQRIEAASDVIAVGVSSCEGYRDEEEQRADIRSKVIRRSIESVSVITDGELYLLLLGQYYDESCSQKSPIQTLDQRSIVIIGVIQKDPGVNLEEAVEDAMYDIAEDEVLIQELNRYLDNPTRSPLGSLDPARYSLFELRI